jgi:hypothetical protein
LNELDQAVRGFAIEGSPARPEFLVLQERPQLRLQPVERLGQLGFVQGHGSQFHSRTKAVVDDLSKITDFLAKVASS